MTGLVQNKAIMKRKYCASKKSTLFDAMSQLDREGVGALFVLDENGSMVGMLTDGDVRRAILRGVPLSGGITEVMNVNFIYGQEGQTKAFLINLMKKVHRRHLPILNKKKKFVDIVLLEELDFNRNDTPVVLMAGGLGARLGNLTKNCPKPMLHVGEKPILETIIRAFNQYGFYNFILSVNYLSHVIESYFGDGAKWGVDIRYLREHKSLGTAGGLSLLKKPPKKAFFVMNGDLLTRLNFQNLLEYHKDHGAHATVTVSEYENRVPYGVVEHAGSYLVRMEEKPLHKYYVNAGIYILEPGCLDLIPKNKVFNMTDLIGALVSRKHKVAMFPIHEYWRDIGHVEELRLANEEFRLEMK